MKFDMTRRLVAEALGTLILVMAVVGSGIMAEKLGGGNQALALLCNTIATGAVLYVIITIFAPVSGAQFQPGGEPGGGASRRARLAQHLRLCCGVDCWRLRRRRARAFDVRARSDPARLDRAHRARPMDRRIHRHVRADRDHSRLRAVQARGRRDLGRLFITSAYWFTASTSFANPAVTIARSLSDTFAGIAPHDAPGFIAAELFGALAGAYLFGWLFAKR